MKRGYFSLVLLFAGALTVRAAVLNEVDPTKMADVNGKTVNTSVLKYGTISQPVLSQTVSPSSGTVVSPGSVLEKKKLDFDTVGYDNVPQKTVPSNFVPKRPADTKPPVATSTVSEPNAQVNPHIIPMRTQEGQQEIKDEFHK